MIHLSKRFKSLNLAAVFSVTLISAFAYAAPPISIVPTGSSDFDETTIQQQLLEPSTTPVQKDKIAEANQHWALLYHWAYDPQHSAYLQTILTALLTDSDPAIKNLVYSDDGRLHLARPWVIENDVDKLARDPNKKDHYIQQDNLLNKDKLAKVFQLARKTFCDAHSSAGDEDTQEYCHVNSTHQKRQEIFVDRAKQRVHDILKDAVVEPVAGGMSRFAQASNDSAARKEFYRATRFGLLLTHSSCGGGATAETTTESGIKASLASITNILKSELTLDVGRVPGIARDKKLRAMQRLGRGLGLDTVVPSALLRAVPVRVGTPPWVPPVPPPAMAPSPAGRGRLDAVSGAAGAARSGDPTSIERITGVFSRFRQGLAGIARRLGEMLDSVGERVDEFHGQQPQVTNRTESPPDTPSVRRPLEVVGAGPAI